MERISKIIAVLIFIIIAVKTFGQEEIPIKEYWSYEKKSIVFGKNNYEVYTLKKFFDEHLKETQSFETQFNTKEISSASFQYPNSKKIKKNEYIWSIYFEGIYLSLLTCYSEEMDSSFTFHLDGISIKSVRYSERFNKPKIRYEMGERYMFDFPEPSPDTLPAFFEKVKKGCPYTPCTVIESNE